MTASFLQHLWAVTALGSGLIGGVFFAFSTFVLRALADLPASQGIGAMQSVNRVVINPLFLLPFLGTAIASLVLAVLSLRDGVFSGGVIAGLLYFVGTFGVTMVGNVPLNRALEKLLASSPASEAPWRAYVTRWGWLNQVRTAAALAACAILIYGRAGD